ncbi:hypothetical protein [Buttiauxella sp.]|uniref:hypothetical protein n=1 Tax=Buttiauxella sp. TaxID=1972222 RepID=UPI003C72E136
MNHSGYLRIHMEADRKIALSLEKGIKSFQENGNEVMSSRTGFATKSAMSYVISKSISESMGFTAKIRAAIGKFSNVTLTLLSFYSYVQKAALSARRLKTLNPYFYQILHHENIEMLYFIIEPVLQKNIGHLNNTLSERDAITILRDIIK